MPSVLGIPLHKPRFTELTAASVMATGLWLAGLALALRLGHGLDKPDAGAFLLVVWWACVAVHCGIDLRAGWRHWCAHSAVVLMLVGLTRTAGVLFT